MVGVSIEMVDLPIATMEFWIQSDDLQLQSPKAEEGLSKRQLPPKDNKEDILRVEEYKEQEMSRDVTCLPDQSVTQLDQVTH